MADALLSVPEKSVRAFCVFCMLRDSGNVVTLNDANLARHLSTPGNPVSQATAYRARTALDARFKGSGHLEHIGERPTDPTYIVRFPFGIPEAVGRSEKIGYANLHNSAKLQTSAPLHKSAKLPTSSNPPHPLPSSSLGATEKTTTTTESNVSRAGVVGVGRAVVSVEEGRRADKLSAAGLLDAGTIADLATRHTDEEIDAAIRAAKSPGAGPGVIVKQLRSGAATKRVQEKAARVAKAQAATAPRRDTPTTPTTPADDFNAAAHAARVDAIPFGPLKDAIRAVVELDHAARAYLTKRGIYSAEAFADGPGTPGREALNKAATHPMIRAALAAHLDNQEAAK